MSSRWSVVVRAVAVLVALGTGAGCNRGPNRKAGDEYLKAIKVEGNKQVSKKQLTSGLALNRTLKRGRPPDPYLVQVDADRIRGDYLRRGFLEADVRSRVERAGDAATVIYTVEEGIRAATKVEMLGLPEDPDLSRDKLRKQLKLKDGAPFDYETYELAKPLLIGVVADAGYAHVKLDGTIVADRANHEALVELAFDTGPKAKFGTVQVQGVEGPLAEAVRNRLQFTIGDTYSTRALAQSQRQLYALGRLSTVQVQADNADSEARNPVVDVKVSVSEAARHEVKLGGGFGIDPTAYEIRGRAGYSIAGFPFPMDTFSVDLRPAYAYARDGSGWQPRIRALAKLERQDIFWTYSRGEVEGGYDYLAVEAYTSYGPRARLGFYTPLGTERVQLRLNWGLQQLAFRDISPLIDDALQMELGLDGTQRIGAYSQAITVDLRDNPVNTKYGAYGELRVVEGTKLAGGAFEYLQLIPELRGFVPLGKVILAARARLGTFVGDAPPTERFYSGGASNHRGFGERKLSPYVQGDVDGKNRTVPYGGTAMFESGLEARIPITTWKNMGVGTVLFLDGGDVEEGLADIDFAKLHWAAGLGLRLNTIVGPVRADFGYRLNRTGPMEPSPGTRFAFHLSLGEAF